MNKNFETSHANQMTRKSVNCSVVPIDLETAFLWGVTYTSS